MSKPNKLENNPFVIVVVAKFDLMYLKKNGALIPIQKQAENSK